MSRVSKSVESEKIVDINGKSVKIIKLKTKKNRSKKHARHTVTTCPICLSTLKINQYGVWDCTGDRLTLWVVEFEKFQKMSEVDQKHYLENMSDPQGFLDLYSKWAYRDENDNRVNFHCGYTNEIYPPSCRVKTRIPDPAFVKTIERQLGRELTDEEKINESDIWIYQGKYSIVYVNGSRKVKIPWVTLPGEED